MDLWKGNNSWPTWQHSIITWLEQRRKGELWVLLTLTMQTFWHSISYLQRQPMRYGLEKGTGRWVGNELLCLAQSCDQAHKVHLEAAHWWCLHSWGQGWAHTVQHLHQRPVWWDTGHLLQRAHQIICEHQLCCHREAQGQAGERNGPTGVSWSSAMESENSDAWGAVISCRTIWGVAGWKLGFSKKPYWTPRWPQVSCAPLQQSRQQPPWLEKDQQCQHTSGALCSAPQDRGQGDTGADPAKATKMISASDW